MQALFVYASSVVTRTSSIAIVATCAAASLGQVVGCSSSNADPPEVYCRNGVPVEGAYPSKDGELAIGKPLPDRTLANDSGGISLRSFFEPCAAEPKILLVRVGAPWCGTCDWHSAHTGEFLASNIGPRLRFLDVLVSDEDNQPPRPEVVTRYRAKFQGLEEVAIDPQSPFLALDVTHGSLPLYVAVDTKTMKVLRVYANPGPDLLLSSLRQDLATLDGVVVPNLVLDERIDEYFGRDQWDLLHEMTLPGAPPADPSNAHADSPDAARFGKALFFDAAFSSNGNVSCATCHVPSNNFSDGLPRAVGIGTGDRRTPSIALASHQRSQFWDGRADSLWMQALFPLENAREMNATRMSISKRIFAVYRAEFEALFGALPALDDEVRFPSGATPGSPEWLAMSEGDREAVTRAFVGVGKSIAAFERTFQVKPTRFDAYVTGDTTVMSDDEKHALHEFFENGCAQCHHGPRLTDDAFHALRFPTGRADGLGDVGRAGGVLDLLASEFRRSGRFSDAPSAAGGVDDMFLRDSAKAMEGRFKTPSLRGLAKTGPFGHGGSIPTVEELARLYGERGLPDEDRRAVGVTEPWVSRFSADHQARIPVLLSVLREDIAGSP